MIFRLGPCLADVRRRVHPQRKWSIQTFLALFRSSSLGNASHTKHAVEHVCNAGTHRRSPELRGFLSFQQEMGFFRALGCCLATAGWWLERRWRPEPGSINESRSLAEQLHHCRLQDAAVMDAAWPLVVQHQHARWVSNPV